MLSIFKRKLVHQSGGPLPLRFSEAGADAAGQVTSRGQLAAAVIQTSHGPSDLDYHKVYFALGAADGRRELARA